MLISSIIFALRSITSPRAIKFSNEFELSKYNYNWKLTFPLFTLFFKKLAKFDGFKIVEISLSEFALRSMKEKLIL